MLVPGALLSFNVTCLIERHPHSPTSNSVVDYTLIYLRREEARIKTCRYYGALPVHIYHEILTMDITEVLSINYVGNTTSGCSGNIVTVSCSSTVVLQE